MYCFHCGSSNLRLSQFRSGDFPGLLLLQIPVRCSFCHDRFYRSLFKVWRAGIIEKPPHIRHQRNRDAGEGLSIRKQRLKSSTRASHANIRPHQTE